jgi:hypothetical protein
VLGDEFPERLELGQDFLPLARVHSRAADARRRGQRNHLLDAKDFALRRHAVVSRPPAQVVRLRA